MSILPPLLAAGELYVFISYAREDQAIAEQVEAFLKAAGVRVFRDTSDIRAGANWNQAIEKALRECQRMVLLLSANSMPEREEVEREWFYFSRAPKLIYPLYIRDCHLNSRFVGVNYIDARGDLQGALEHLLDELRRDSDLPPPAASRPLPEPLHALYDVVRDPSGNITLSAEQVNAIKLHHPADLTEYRLRCIAEWSLPQHYLDKRFVNLTLILDKGEDAAQRWQKLPAEAFRFQDLRDVLVETKDDPALVLLGAPGQWQIHVAAPLAARS